MLSVRKMITALTLLCVCTVEASAAIDIVFDYSYDTGHFFDTQQKRDTLDAAAQVFEDCLQDSLDAVINYYGDGGWNTWDAGFYHPYTNQWMLVDSSQMAYQVEEDRIVIFAGGRSMGSQTLGIGGPGGFSASGYTSDWFDLIKSRGEDGALDGATASDFGPWGGSVSFTTDVDWNYDHTQMPGSNQSDFYSVALHEIGHVLGLGTADSWNANVSGGYFNGINVVMEYGAAVQLDAGSVHWQEGTISETVAGLTQEGLMDPTTTRGHRKVMTYLDYAALEDIGWEVEIPEPVYDCIDGDINCDGVVGLLDLDVLGRNWGNLGATWSDGDLNGNGSVTLLDLDILGSTWGDVAPVPEPGSGALLCLALTVAWRRR